MKEYEIKALIRKNYPYFSSDNISETFRTICNNGDLEALDLIMNFIPNLEEFSIVDFSDFFENAVVSGHVNIVGKLLELTKNPEQKKQLLSKKMLVIAIDYNHVNIANKLLAYIKNEPSILMSLTTFFRDEYFPFVAAKGYISVLKVMLEFYGSMDKMKLLTSNKTNKVLHLLLLNNEIKTTSFLLDQLKYNSKEVKEILKKDIIKRIDTLYKYQLLAEEFEMEYYNVGENFKAYIKEYNMIELLLTFFNEKEVKDIFSNKAIGQFREFSLSAGILNDIIISRKNLNDLGWDRTKVEATRVFCNSVNNFIRTSRKPIEKFCNSTSLPKDLLINILLKLSPSQEELSFKEQKAIIEILIDIQNYIIEMTRESADYLQTSRDTRHFNSRITFVERLEDKAKELAQANAR